jgi:hypothetical protein
VSGRLTRARPAAAAGLALTVATLFPGSAYASRDQVWLFTVYLDETPIGHHEFILSEQQAGYTITSRARFDVTFLKLPLFRYRHDNLEHWKDRCLDRIASSTDRDGQMFSVEGAATDKGFRVSTAEKELTYPGCVSTFAYWDKSFLEHSRLLNAQTGEYVEVDVRDTGRQTIPVRDTSVSAESYRLTADDLDIELWYSPVGQWLGLQSAISGGRVLRYEIN